MFWTREAFDINSFVKVLALAEITHKLLFSEAINFLLGLDVIN